MGDTRRGLRPGAAWPGNARLVSGCGEGWGGGHSGGEARLFILARKFLEVRRETISERAPQLHVATSECNSVYHSQGGAALPCGHTGGSRPHPVPAQPHPTERRRSQAQTFGATQLRCRDTAAAPQLPPTAQATHHLDGRVAEVGLRHRGVIALHHVNPFPGQGLDDRLVSLQGGHLVPFEDEAAHAAVQLAGQQELDDRRLDVLLLVLVDVEGVPEVLGDVICSDRRPPRVGVTPKCSRTGSPQSLPASWSCWWDGSQRMSSWGRGCGDGCLQGKVCRDLALDSPGVSGARADMGLPHHSDPGSGLWSGHGKGHRGENLDKPVVNTGPQLNSEDQSLRPRASRTVCGPRAGPERGGLALAGRTSHGRSALPQGHSRANPGRYEGQSPTVG